MASSDNASASPSAASPTTFVAVQTPRDPGTFSAQPGLDVDKWLRLYERVSQTHRWDPTMMLANVLFYLDGTPRVWYETNESELTSWDTFKEKLRDIFGDPTGRHAAARQELATRVQSPTESYVSYIQEVLALCRKVDEAMSEAEKVGHVLKGIADDAFNLLVYTNVSTIDRVIQECRRFETAKSRRVRPPFSRLPNTAATSTCSDSTVTPPFEQSVTRIVRRELEAASPAPLQPTSFEHTIPTTPAISVIQAVVRQEFANRGFPDACPISCPSSRPIPINAPRRDPFVAPRSRNPAEWRTPDDKPICFRCHRVGHVSRYCRASWTPPHRSQFFAPYSPYEDLRRYSSSRTAPAFDTSNSRLPARSPSPQRRRSPSPQPRRHHSPPNFSSYPTEN